MHAHDPEIDLPGEPSASATEIDALTAARALLAQEQQDRMQACAGEIEAVLQRYGMRLEITPAQITLAPA
ncbi:hypothetical protein ACFZCP_14485 [Streptomyces sp. NPDC007971]|uniref:hypothetical protein n=1 Tax=Streptomyces sp. NPDC007971 TaxID=3364799 RepID=UPI0036E8E13F